MQAIRICKSSSSIACTSATYPRLSLGADYHFNSSLDLCAREGEKRLFPSFSIIGQFKCGTTGLAGSLVFHPQIKASSRQELNHCDVRVFQMGLDWYAQHFPCDSSEE